MGDVYKQRESFLETLWDHQREVDGTAVGLRQLARCFSRLGNREVADELGAYAEAIATSVNKVASAYGSLQTAEVHAGQEEIGGILKAVLAGQGDS